MEQYTFLSPRDLEVEEARGNVLLEKNVNLLNNREYYARIKFTEEGYNLDYIHREQERISHLPLWRTRLSFQGKTVYSLSSTKKNSLRVAVSMLDTHIREYLGV